MKFFIWVLGLTAVASADWQANNLMDSVLRQASNKAGHLKLNPFKVKVKSVGSQSGLTAEFIQGTINGFSSLRRARDCTSGTHGSDKKIGCYISLAPLYIQANVRTKTTNGKTGAVNTASQVGNAYALIEIRGRRGKAPSIEKITVESMGMTTRVTSGSIDISQSRFQEFVRQANDKLANQLRRALTGSYRSMLNTIVRNTVMP